MSSFNKAIVMGRLGADPEVRTLGDTTVAKLSVATHSAWTDKQGVKQERTQWHRVKVWGRQAETCQNYLTKGSVVLVEGALETQSYDDAQGVKRFVTEIKARDVRFVGGKGGRDDVAVPKTSLGAGVVEGASWSGSADDVPF